MTPEEMRAHAYTMHTGMVKVMKGCTNRDMLMLAGVIEGSIASCVMDATAEICERLDKLIPKTIPLPEATKLWDEAIERTRPGKKP